MSTTSSASGKPAGEIRVRFAPSPTGYLHVGGARTALFNWLFARGRGGTMILRIEDTDIERNRPELVEGILDGLRWLGVDWDEGPYFQSQRLELHREAALKLAASGAAYFCDCPPEKYAGGDAVDETEDEKKEQGPRRITRCACREGKPGLSAENAAIRFRVPLGATTQFEDAVFGPREVSNEEIEDFVLLRSPKEGQTRGGPTYQLSAVVDDIDMRITHVIRGSDHISNTPKQALLYRALGAAPPIFAHVPLILGPDRTRLSKRHGATSVGSYRDEGFLPEAFRNFLALLGWSAGDDRIHANLGNRRAIFARRREPHECRLRPRRSSNGSTRNICRSCRSTSFFLSCKASWSARSCGSAEWAGEKREWFSKTVDLLRPRTRLLPDFSTWARAFFSDSFEYDPQAREKFWKDERLGAMLGKLADALAALPDWNHDACDHALRELAAAEGVKAGLLINATRVAIVGQAVAPPLFETMLVIGQERVVSRLRRAVEAFAAR